VVLLGSKAIPQGGPLQRGRIKPTHDPTGQQSAEALRPFHVVLDQVVSDAPEEIDLQAGNL
jgi:hypothetical protein